MAYFKLNIGQLDLSRYVAKRGFQIKYTDTETNIVTLDGTTHRGRMATKRQLVVKLIPTNYERLSFIVDALSEEYVSVTFHDPLVASDVTAVMFCKVRPTLMIAVVNDGSDDGQELWELQSFTLMEK